MYTLPFIFTWSGRLPRPLFFILLYLAYTDLSIFKKILWLNDILMLEHTVIDFTGPFKRKINFQHFSNKNNIIVHT